MHQANGQARQEGGVEIRDIQFGANPDRVFRLMKAMTLEAVQNFRIRPSGSYTHHPHPYCVGKFTQLVDGILPLFSF
jgi:hypothetical protein